MTVVDGVRLVSNSEVQTHKDCPRKWWLAWYRGLKPKQRKVSGASSTGTRIHVALAALYTPSGSFSQAQAALANAQLADREEYDRQAAARSFSEDAGQVVAALEAEMKTLTSAFDMEQAMLDGYLDWIEESGVDQHLEVVSVEQRVEVDLFSESDARGRGWRYPVRLIAKLDARVRNTLTGALKFIDHKTVGTLHDPVLGINQQMLHYHVIDMKSTPPELPRAEGALYNMLRKVKRTRAAKPPFYARVPIDHNHHELSGYIRQLTGVIDQLERAETVLEETSGPNHQRAVPSRPSRDCVWKCQFLKICRMFDDGSRVEAAIEEHYEVGDPLAYYDSEEISEGTV